jgi:hypothetical protein
MNILVLIFGAIILLFVVLLAIKKITQLRFCVICASISLIWMSLLVLQRLGLFDNLVLIAVLMGGSIVGIYYWLEKKVREQLHLFRLPVLLSLMFLAYVLLGAVDDALSTIGLLGVLWVIFGFLYAYQSNNKVHNIVARIIACCRDW